MANFTLKRVDVFPSGTTVGAYPATNWPTWALPPAGAPQGAAAATAVSDGVSIAFTGLTVGVEYFAVAQVGGVYRYIGFRVAGAPETRYPLFGSGFVDKGVPVWDQASSSFIGRKPAPDADWRTLFSASSIGFASASLIAAGVWFGATRYDNAVGAYSNQNPPFNLALARMLSANILYRVVCTFAINGVGPGVTLTPGIYSVTNEGGGAGAISAQAGAVALAGSPVASPAAGAVVDSVGAGAAVADGAYMFGIAISAALAASSAFAVRIALQYQYTDLA